MALVGASEELMEDAVGGDDPVSCLYIMQHSVAILFSR